jgi:rhamnosyltransferase
MRTALCLLTLNAATTAQLFLDALAEQTLPGVECLVIDSASDDGTANVFSAAGFRIHNIPRDAFDHGATRKLALDLNPDAEIIIYMTQDAILANPSSLQNLVESFNDPLVGAAFGRQLPTGNSTPIAGHARLFNYPVASRVKSLADAPTLGIKTPFISNSFAAYRRTAMESVGGFPSNVILSEDTFVAAKMLLAGWKVAYCAEAQVFHSHGYGYIEEFRRYFDTGVFHAREPWIRRSFGRAEGEGLRFVRSELKFLWPGHFYLIPSAIVRSFAKIIAFKLGGWERWLPLWLKASLSMNKNFWVSEPSRRLAASKDGTQGKRSC